MEWVILLPLTVLGAIALIGTVLTDWSHLPIAAILLAIMVGLNAVNYASWMGQPWALWIRTGLAFTAAIAFARHAPANPGLYVLAVERMMQTGVCVHVLYRRE